MIRHAQSNQRGIVRERAKRDRAALLPLPPDPYLLVSRTQGVVGRDGYFSFEGHRYALPSGLQTPGGRVELVLGVHEMEALFQLGQSPGLLRARKTLAGGR